MRALITGITGQDGQYLTELLLEKNYEVYGLVRNTNIRVPNVEVIYGDITDPPFLPQVDEVYNLAAMSHVGESFKMPRYTFEANTLGAVSMMDAAFDMGARFYQASSSELFGNADPPQTIDTPMNPVSPYGVSKLAAHKHAAVMRSQGLFACTGIAFNHESPRRGMNFVSQKICHAVKNIKEGKQDILTLGNVKTRRDWGHAKDTVSAMFQIMHQEEPGDYIIATGVSHSVLNFVDEAFYIAGIPKNGHVIIDRAHLRPNDPVSHCGVTNVPCWGPLITFKAMVKEMIDAA